MLGRKWVITASMKGNNVVDTNDRSVVVPAYEVGDDEGEDSDAFKDVEGSPDADQVAMTTSLPLSEANVPHPPIVID